MAATSGSSNSSGSSRANVPPEQQGERTSTLLEVPLEQLEIKVPSFCKGPVLLFLLFLAFVAASIASFVLSATLDGRPSTTKWRVTTRAEAAWGWAQWEICALLPYSDDQCNDLIDISNSEVLAFPPLPNGWKEHNLEEAEGSSDKPCTACWKAGAAQDIDNPPYIKWTFPSPKKVGCFKVQYSNGSTGWWSEVVPTIIEAYEDGTWVAQRTTQFKNLEEWDRISTVPESFESHPQDSPYKMMAMAAGHALAINAPIFLLVFISSLRDYRTQKEGRLALQEEVRLGTAFIATSSPQQWAAFVQGTWGWGGTVHRAQHSSRKIWIGTFVFIAVLMAWTIKLHSIGKTPALSWWLCLLWGMGTSLLTVCPFQLFAEATRRNRFNHLKRGQAPAIVGTSSIYFANILVGRDKILSSVFVTAQAQTFFIVIWSGGLKKKMKLSVPVADSQVDQLKAFVLQNSETYHWTPPAPTQDDIETGSTELTAVTPEVGPSGTTTSAAGVLQDEEPASSSTGP